MTKDYVPNPEARVGTPDRLITLQLRRGLQLESLQLWATSPERAWYMERRSSIYWYVIGAVFLPLVVGLWVAFRAPRSDSAFRVEVVVAVLGAVVLAWCTVPYWAARRAFLERKRALAAYRVDVALQRVCDSKSGDSLPLSGLFELNRRQLDEYQEMTKRQERVAFQLTWAAATLAFVVLIGGTALSLRVDPGSKQYVVGGLTGLGTLLSGFLGKTFFEGHRHAMDQLNYYYAEPSMTGRMLAAERVVNKLGVEGQAEHASAIVNSLLSWKPPPAPSSGGGSQGSPKGKDNPGEDSVG